jgi:hypothetical protein
MKKKKTTSVLKHHGESYALNGKQKETAISQEDQWFKEDNLILETKAVRNHLEAYCYAMKGDLDQYGGILKDYIDPEKTAPFLAEVEKIVEWLYADGEHAAKDAYQTKYDALKAVGEPCKWRRYFHEEAPHSFANFEKMSKQVNDKFANTEHMTEEDNQAILKHYQECEAYITLCKQVIDQPKHQPHDFNLKEVDAKILHFHAEALKVLNRPKPEPKKEEPKKEEPAAEGAAAPEEKKEGDTEMKDESAPAAAEEKKE